MLNVFRIFRRELISYFLTPMAYIILTIFLFLSGVTFVGNLVSQNMDPVRFLFYWLNFFALMLCPLISMRLLSEEFRSGTIESLMTVPVKDYEVILGKFLGGMGFYVSLHIPTLVYILIVRWLGDPDLGVVQSSYLGSLLLGAVFLSMGTLCSCATSNQIIAASIAFIANFALMGMSLYAETTPGKFGDILDYMGYVKHYEPFYRGVMDSRDLLYFMSMTVFFLFLSVRVLESRRWR